MKLLEPIHERYIVQRRLRRLVSALAPLVPQNASLLDVGCGDGSLALALLQRRPDLRIQGVDVLVRPVTHIPVTAFDGVTLPFDAATFDAVLLVDVLHHTSDPRILLREAARVARECVVLKDHRADGWGAWRTLRFMDDLGNRRFGVALPYNYWSSRQWQDAFAELGYSTERIETKLGIYPFPFSLLFDRGLHFAARLKASDS